MSEKRKYQEGKIQQLLSSDAVSTSTRNALNDRMQKRQNAPTYFDAFSFGLLSVICDRLVGQNSADRIVDIAGFIDQRLTDKAGKGWRYNFLPPEGAMYKSGLKSIDESSHFYCGVSFLNATMEEQIFVLECNQKNREMDTIWMDMPANVFFEELLAEVTEIFYAFPLVHQEIGFNGMADVHGWKKIGLNENDEIDGSS